MRTFPCLPSPLLSALDGLLLDKIWVVFSLEWSKALAWARKMVTEPDANFFSRPPFLNVSQYEKHHPSAYPECLLSCYLAMPRGRGVNIELIFRLVCCFM